MTVHKMLVYSRYMATIDISQVTAKRLSSGEYKRDFPEYYDLEGTVENSLWHNHQDVFEHVVMVYENLEKELRNISPKVYTYLDQRIGNYTRLSILKIATLLHDIAKKETLITADNGNANCPGHEHLAAGMVKNFSELFLLDNKCQEYVERIVLHHGFVSEVIAQSLHKPTKENIIWNRFIDAVGDISYELLILIKADDKACDLEELAPEQFYPREKLLIRWLKEKTPK